MPTIICPTCGTANRPAGLSALDCTGCARTIDPRQLGGSPETFIRRQRKLRKKSESGTLGEDEADELLEWILSLPADEGLLGEDAEPLRRSSPRFFGLLTGPWRWMRANARRQRPGWLYADSVVRMGDDGIVISGYYWPIGRKRIPYIEIRGFASRPLRAWHGQYRVQGVDHRGRWYSRDRHRGEKEQAIDLTVGRLIHPVLTPDDVDAVLEILDQKANKVPD